jgi:hypothetical protein
MPLPIKAKLIPFAAGTALDKPACNTLVMRLAADILMFL